MIHMMNMLFLNLKGLHEIINVVKVDQKKTECYLSFLMNGSLKVGRWRSARCHPKYTKILSTMEFIIKNLELGDSCIYHSFIILIYWFYHYLHSYIWKGQCIKCILKCPT